MIDRQLNVVDDLTRSLWFLGLRFSFSKIVSVMQIVAELFLYFILSISEALSHVPPYFLI